MSITVTALFRYPVKGLSPESLKTVELSPGEGFPGDRRFAFARGSTVFDPANPEWQPKTRFLMLARNAKLAALTTRFDEETNVLTVLRDGKEVAHGALTSHVGKALLADFFAAYLKDDLTAPPKVVEAPGFMFSDHRNKVISIINRESLEDLERVVGKPVDPRRFRANIMIEGTPAWSEFDWVDKEIRIGDARLVVTKRINRCAATTVNPDTGTIDMNIPKALQRGYGHIDFGIYGRVLDGGPVTVGETLLPPA